MTTTPEPGLKLVLTNGFTLNPAWIAFFANNPAAKMTPGFEVFVQEVIAAITTDPLLIVYSYPLYLNVVEAFNFSYVNPNPLKPTGFVKQEFQSYFILCNVTLSCGLFGPETHPTTVAKSNSKTSPE